MHSKYDRGGLVVDVALPELNIVKGKENYVAYAFYAGVALVVGAALAGNLENTVAVLQEMIKEVESDIAVRGLKNDFCRDFLVPAEVELPTPEYVM